MEWLASAGKPEGRKPLWTMGAYKRITLNWIMEE
jgi:hypothetical protein